MSALSQIHPDAKIAEDVEIGPFCVIGADVVIETGTKIHNGVTIYSGARIGKNCELFPGVVVAAVPQDLKFDGEYSTAEIGEGTVLREYVTVNRGTSHRGKTVVGKNCLLLAYCHVAHDCIVGDEVIMSNATQLAGHVEVEHNATISGLTGVHQFVRIGAYSMVAGAILVRKDVPPYVTAAKDPTVFSGVNLVGLRRRGFSDEQIASIQECYRILYRGGQNFSQAPGLIRERVADGAERDAILTFIEKSDRGIIPGRKL